MKAIKDYYEDCRYLEEEGFFFDSCVWVKKLGCGNFFELMFLPDEGAFLGSLFGEDYGFYTVKAETAKECVRLLRNERNAEDFRDMAFFTNVTFSIEEEEF